MCLEKKKEDLHIEDNIDASIKRLVDYINKSKKRWITAASNRIDKVSTNRTTKTRKQKWEGKQLYGYFKRQTDEITHKKTGTLQRKRNLKRETEIF